MNRGSSSTIPFFIGALLLTVLAALWYLDSAAPVTEPDGDPQASDAAREEIGVGSDGLSRAEYDNQRNRGRESGITDAALAGFRGRVVPVEEGVSVSILRFDDLALVGDSRSLLTPERLVPPLVAGRSLTGIDGVFRITGVWPGSFYVLHARSSGGQVIRRLIERAPGPGEIVDLGDIHLEASAVIVGLVTDGQGRPLTGATVRSAPVPSEILRSWPLERFDLVTPVLHVDGDASHVLEIPAWIRERLEQDVVVSTRTDGSGRFRLRGVSPTDAAVFVTATNRTPAIRTEFDYAPDTATDLGTIVLDSGETIVGRVLDDRRRPIAGAELLLGQGTSVAPLVFPAPARFTRADGGFSASGFRVGRCIAAVRRNPGSPWIVRAGSVGKEFIIALPGTCDLTLRVRSRAGIELLEPRFKLLAATPDADDVDLSLLGFKNAVPLDGRLAQQGDGTFLLSDLQKGRYILIADAPGHATRFTPFSLESTLELAIDLERQRSFEVMVSDSDGEPVANARVLLQSEGEFPRIPRHPIACGTTGENGRLTVTQATCNRLLVRAKHPAHGTAHQHVELPLALVHIRLEAHGSLAGALTERGQTPQPGKWSLSIRHTHSHDRIVLPRLAKPGEDGRYRVDGLAPGYYKVSILEAGRASPIGLALQPDRFADRFESRTFTTRIPVHPGRTTELDMDAVPEWEASKGPTANVSGTVTINGRPATGFEVRGWHKRWLIGRVVDNGRFDLGEVALGEVGLYVVNPKSSREGRFEMLRWESVSIRGNQPVELNIDLELGSISGRVIHADGHGVVGCLVKLDRRYRGPKGKWRRSVFHDVSSRRGAFEFQNLPSGMYTATVWDQSHGRVTVPDLAVRNGGRSDGVILRLRRVVTIEGRVELAAMGSERPQWSWLRLYGKDAQGRLVSKEPGTKIRADGRFSLHGVPPGTYEVSIGGRFRKPGKDFAWETRMFVHEADLVVGAGGLRGITLRPRPSTNRKRRRPTEPKPGARDPGARKG
jgi:hypothetical protein